MGAAEAVEAARVTRRRRRRRKLVLGRAPRRTHLGEMHLRVFGKAVYGVRGGADPQAAHEETVGDLMGIAVDSIAQQEER